MSALDLPAPVAVWLAVIGTLGAVALLVPPRVRPWPLDPATSAAVPDPLGARGADGWMLRHRVWWSALAGVAAATFLTGTAGLVGGGVVAVGAWVLIGRAEPPSARRERLAVARDLPHVVGLLADALAAGQDPGTALGLVCQALPGAAADRMADVAPRLTLGADPAEVWAGLVRDPDLAVLGRTLARAHATGAPVGVAVARLGEELARASRADVEDQARQVGVKAAVPLGLCLLPAFVLIGIVPLVAGLVSTLDLG